MVHWRTSQMRRRHWAVVATIAIAVVCASWPKAQSPLFVWNVSPSVPVGLYVIDPRQPSRGELAALRLPEPIRSLADARGYVEIGMVLIKPVAAISGDVICRRGLIVTVNSSRVAHALPADASGRPLPEWSGCYDVDQQGFLVLSDEPNSFDGRYFGLVAPRNVIGTAASLTVDAVLAAVRSKR